MDQTVKSRKLLIEPTCRRDVSSLPAGVNTGFDHPLCIDAPALLVKHIQHRPAPVVLDQRVSSEICHDMSVQEIYYTIAIVQQDMSARECHIILN